MISLLFLIAAVVLSILASIDAPTISPKINWFKVAFACFMLSLLMGRYSV